MRSLTVGVEKFKVLICHNGLIAGAPPVGEEFCKVSVSSVLNIGESIVHGILKLHR
jgi:hypothetical protein